MPTYSYRCTDCAIAFDIQQAFADDSLTECPTCGGNLRKVFSAIGVSFTGSGFYRNDSRAEAGAKGDGSKGDGAKGDGAKGDGIKEPAAAKASDGASGVKSGTKTAESATSGVKSPEKTTASTQSSSGSTSASKSSTSTPSRT